MIWLLDSAGARIQEAVGSLFAGSGHLFREEVDHVRRDPAGRGADGTRARPAPPTSRGWPTSCRWCGAAARWRWPGRIWSAPRSARTSPRRSSAARACTAASRASATWRSSRRPGLHRGDQAVPELLPAELRGAAAGHADQRPDRPRRRGAARRPAGLEPQALRHVRGDPPDRRRRRLLRPEAAVGQDDHHLPGPVRRAPGRDRRQPAPPARRDPRQRLGRQGGALHQPLQRLRPAARLPDGRARASWSGPRSSRRGSSATAPRCSTRPPTPPCPRSPSCCARPTAPATT